MNNPLSRRPEHALFPYPPGCTGHRILGLLQRRVPGVTRGQYLKAFDRRNLLNAQVWSARDAADAAIAFVEQVRDTGVTVVVLGDGPRNALDLPKRLIHPYRRDGVVWRQLPHPSGRNHWYNDETCRDLASLLLQELYEASTKGEH